MERLQNFDSEFEGSIPSVVNTNSQPKRQTLTTKQKLALGLTLGAVCLVGLAVAVSLEIKNRPGTKPTLNTAVMRLTPIGMRPEAW